MCVVTALPTCVEPTMFHLAYRFRFLRIQNVDTCGMAHRCRIPAVQEVKELGTLFLCNSGKRDLGKWEREYICRIIGEKTYLTLLWLGPCTPALLPKDFLGQAEVIRPGHTGQQLRTLTGVEGSRCAAVRGENCTTCEHWNSAGSTMALTRACKSLSFST